MTRLNLVFTTALLTCAVAQRSQAQEPAPTLPPETPTIVAITAPITIVAVEDTAKPVVPAKVKRSFLSTAPQVEMQNYRPEDKRGINVFEAPKDESVAYDGFKLQWGAAFTQQFQGLDHRNTAAPRMVGTVTPVNANQVIRIGHGFNNANANLYLNAQLARGIRVQMTTYASARRHNETWVKDGFLLIDASPIDWRPLNQLMKVVTIRAGHFEINYGDAHFRRTDNGNAIRNPLVGNYILDAFTTEVGGEIYLRGKGFLGMFGVTGGEVRGMTREPEKRSPTYLTKVGYDKQFTDAMRFRLTASSYATAKSVNNSLYSGDRAGSRYYNVLENTTSTESAQPLSGAIQPGMRNSIHAYVVNPFVQIGGLELFGNFERAKGRAATETANRTWRQSVGEAVYRFLPNKQLYVVGRYNTAKGELTVGTPAVSVNRTQFGGGWFLTPNLLLKSEYVNQKYNDFPTTDIRNGGRFKGFMVEGVVAF